MTQAGELIRVLIVDDDALVRSALRLVLGGDPQLRIVAEAADGVQALEQVRATEPDVVLMDIRMPVLDGLGAVEQIMTQRCEASAIRPEVIVLTTFHADDQVLRAVRLGASGFLLKDTAPQEILAAIHRVAGGDPVLSPVVARQVMAAAVSAATDPRVEQAQKRIAALTGREREVALAIGRGLTNAEIAAELYLSPATVKSYVTQVFLRLGVQNRVQVALAVHHAGQA